MRGEEADDDPRAFCVRFCHRPVSLRGQGRPMGVPQGVSWGTRRLLEMPMPWTLVRGTAR